MIKFSSRIENVQPSPTLALTAKAKKLQSEGKDIVNFGAGEPDFDTPDFIKEEAIAAIKSGFTKYTPTTGTQELKQAICEKFKRDNSLLYSPEQIVVSCGAKQGIFNALMVLVERQDEVIIPVPYWVSYPEMVSICEGKSIFIKAEKTDSFKITPQKLKSAISPKTKVLILNSPSNPAGCVYSEKEIREIAETCVKHKILVISDEIYEKLIYGQVKHFSIASIGRDIYDLTVTVNGVSKAYSMTGWRIGYLGAPVEIIKAIARLQDHTTSNPSSISQKAALAALKGGDTFISSMREEFRKRRDYACGRLDNIGKISYSLPGGAFYIFCSIAATGLNSTRFSERLLEEANVAVIPGANFGDDTCIRISFATSMEKIKQGMDRLQDWMGKLGAGS